MVGRDMRQATPLVGDAEVEFSFAANTVDVTISEIRKRRCRASIHMPITTAGSVRMGRTASQLGCVVLHSGFGNDRSDTGSSSVYGYIDGDFYGAGAEEVAGVFEPSRGIGSLACDKRHGKRAGRRRDIPLLY